MDIVPTKELNKSIDIRVRSLKSMRVVWLLLDQVQQKIRPIYLHVVLEEKVTKPIMGTSGSFLMNKH